MGCVRGVWPCDVRGRRAPKKTRRSPRPQAGFSHSRRPAHPAAFPQPAHPGARPLQGRPTPTARPPTHPPTPSPPAEPSVAAAGSALPAAVDRPPPPSSPLPRKRMGKLGRGWRASVEGRRRASGTLPPSHLQWGFANRRTAAGERSRRAGQRRRPAKALPPSVPDRRHPPPTHLSCQVTPPVRAEEPTRGCRGAVDALLAQREGGGMESRRAQPCMTPHRAVSRRGRRRSPQTEGASDSGVVWVCHALGQGGGGRAGPAGAPWTPTWETRGGWRRGAASWPASAPPRGPQ